MSNRIGYNPSNYQTKEFVCLVCEKNKKEKRRFGSLRNYQEDNTCEECKEELAFLKKIKTITETDKTKDNSDKKLSAIKKLKKNDLCKLFVFLIENTKKKNKINN
jgi:transcription initiation factor IIE alpha subunit